MSNKQKARGRLPRPATVLAAIAVFAALAGTATAANGLINGQQIKRGTIAAKQIKRGAITGAQIKNRSVPVSKLNPAAIKRLSGARGPQGPQGAQGAPGAQGETGPQGPAGLIVPLFGTAAASVNIPNGPETTVFTLGVPSAGKYVINAKTNLFAVQDTVRAECSLYAGGSSVDMVQWTAAEANARQSVSLQAVADAAPGGPARVTCLFIDGNGSASQTKITAIPVS